MIKYKYFIKTEQEFINEFGINWRDKNYDGFYFVSGMDYLLGTKVDKLSYDMLSIWEYFVLGRYRITQSMVKKVNLIEYNNKRELVYE